MKKIILSIVFAMAIANVFGATYYWVGGSGTAGSPKDWNTGLNWSTTSGGVGGSEVPGTADIAVFDATTGNASPFVNINGYSITLTGLQILPASAATANNVVSFIGTATSFAISGDMTINAIKPGSTQYNGQISDNGNNTISIAGNINCNAASSCTLVTASSTNTNPTPGRIALTGATPTIGVNATGGNLGFLNFDISSSTNATFVGTANAFTINGNLNIQTGGKLTITKTLQFNSAVPSGSNPFISQGTISGGGTVVGSTSWSLNIGGALPATYTSTNLQSIGTINMDPTSAATSSVNSITYGRPNSTVTIGTCNNNTFAVAGTINLNSGVLNDGGNIITVAGGTILATTNTTEGVAVHTGTGRIRAIRSSATNFVGLITPARTITVGNLEIFNSPTSTLYPLGAGTNLTINGTLTLSKSGSGINASGSTITFQNANVPIALTAGTITTNASTTLNFGTTGNTGGAAFSIPNGLFTSSPTVATLNITRDNPLTLNNQAITATTINVNAGSKLSLGANVSSTTLNIKSDASKGTATFVDNGYTVTATNSNIEQYLPAARNFYISAPVTGATAAAGPQYWKFVEALNNGSTWTVVNSGAGFDMGTGYVLRPTAASTYTFTGAINTGNKSITGLTSTATAKTGFNLVGNPYPSYVRWSEVARTNVGETMWYRTHDGNAYQFYTYHTVDGRGIGVPATVTDYIPPMQAFWVKVNAAQTGTLAFDNAKRYHQDVAGNAFRAPAQQKAWHSFVRLQVRKAELTDETVIYMHHNATDAFDSYDSEKMFNANPNMPEIFTQIGNKQLVINGVSAQSDEKVLPLGFNTATAGNFEIAVSELLLPTENAALYLYDNVRNVETALLPGTKYAFDAPISSGTTRFTLRFSIPTLSTNAKNTSSEFFEAYALYNGRIEVSSSQANLQVDVFNIAGQKIYSELIANGQIVLNKQFEKGLYLLKTNVNEAQQTIKVLVK